jgi:ABC-2 type transport system ATP-binding protein
MASAFWHRPSRRPSGGGSPYNLAAMPVAVSFQHVSKVYRGSLKALDDVSFDIEAGEFFGLLGPNGAGKTTLISILAGLARASGGQVSVLGHDVVDDYANSRRLLGVVPQELVFDPFFSVRETLRIQGGYFGIRNNDDWIDELLASLGLADRADANMRQLSGGMKRRVLVAQALVHKPPVIVLDEPTAGVDVELRQVLWQFVRRLNRDGHTIVLTTHYLEEAETQCNRIAMLKAGSIVALDSTRNLLDSFSGLELRLRLDREALPQPFPGRLTSQEGALFVLQLRDYLELEEALTRLRQADATIVEMELQPPDLEDVFLRFTGK